MAENAKEQRDGQNMKILQKMIDDAEKNSFLQVDGMTLSPHQSQNSNGSLQQQYIVEDSTGT